MVLPMPLRTVELLEQSALGGARYNSHLPQPFLCQHHCMSTEEVRKTGDGGRVRGQAGLACHLRASFPSVNMKMQSACLPVLVFLKTFDLVLCTHLGEAGELEL